MTDTCTYSGNREEALIAYLYEEGDPVARRTFERHLDACGICRGELEALGGVRETLAKWAPPEPNFHVGAESRIPNPESPSRTRWWRDVPAWAQAAAALLFLGVSAGLANLDVRYDRNGLAVRTGWMAPRPSTVDSRQPTPAGQPEIVSSAATRDDLAALARQLRAELGASNTAAPARSTASDPETLRQVRSLLDQSEKRQERELALRVAELVQNVNAQRQADLVRIDRNLGMMQTGFTTEALKQRESLNLLYRASLRQ